MNIKFVKDRSEYFAISENAVWNGKVCDELLFCELIPVGINTYSVRWEDTYSKPEFFNSLGEAKEYVIKNYMKHIPHINGAVYDLD